MKGSIGNDPTGTGKLDAAPTDGLEGAEDSLAYRVHEIEKHLHNWERWLAAAAVPNGEIHVADPIADNAVPFVIDAGNDDWGSWVQIIGSDDTPVITDMEKFDLHRVEVVAWEVNSLLHIVQIAFGETAAGALAAGDYTEFPFQTGQGTAKVTPIDILAARRLAGTKAWARTFAPGQNTATFSFYIGLHEYIG